MRKIVLESRARSRRQRSLAREVREEAKDAAPQLPWPAASAGAGARDDARRRFGQVDGPGHWRCHRANVRSGLGLRHATPREREKTEVERIDLALARRWRSGLHRGCSANTDKPVKQSESQLVPPDASCAGFGRLLLCLCLL